MRKRAAIFIGLIATAAVLLVAFFKNECTPFKKQVSDSSKSSSTSAGTSASPSAVPPPPVGGNRDHLKAVVREIQTSSDIYATFEKYKGEPDPTGAIAFHLSLAMGDCVHFAHKSLEQLSKEMNAVGPRADQSADRRKAIELGIQRCRGFKDWGVESVTSTVMSLDEKSKNLGYPGAVASALPIRLGREDPEGPDADAIRLLSGEIDGAVLKNIYNYLAIRNGEAWLAQFGDPAVTTAAWALLQCNYGSNCDVSNPIVSTACIYYAACDRHDVASALPAMYPTLTEERLREAVRLVPLLASQIQGRDWVRLGFYKQQEQRTNPKP